MTIITAGNKELILSLHSIGAIAFGSFTLKSGMISPIYLDLRRVVSHPHLLKAIAASMHAKVSNLSFELICGVPYTALPMATVFSILYKKPMVMRRKEAKGYGTKQMIEGTYVPGQSCLVIEDLITSGTSILETVAELNRSGLVVRDAIAVIDREQGGAEYLKSKGIRFYSLFTLSECLETLLEENLLSSNLFDSTMEFIRNNQIIPQEVGA
jgi:uridine monophosphate synthetase